MKEEKPTIQVCRGHQKEFLTPLIWTFAFNNSEYWCPYCGKHEEMFGAGINLESTAKLRNRLKRFRKLSKDYLKAHALKSCDLTLWEDKWIKPNELPQTELERLKAAERNWKYHQKPSKKINENNNQKTSKKQG